MTTVQQWISDSDLDTYGPLGEQHQALADDPNVAPSAATAGPGALVGAAQTAAPLFTRAPQCDTATGDGWACGIVGHTFLVARGHTPIACPICDTLCPVCESGVHPAHQCPAVVRERARQALGARVWARFQNNADFIARLREATETERAAAADAIAAYLTAVSGTLLTTERVLSAWTAMLGTSALEALEAELPFLLAAYDTAKLQDDEQAYGVAARALEAFYTRKAAYLKAQRIASEHGE
jgi:hypothetical protein